jgi:hypothetical protein
LSLSSGFNSVEVATHAQQAVAATIATTISPAPLLTHQTPKNLHSKRPNCKTPNQITIF